jgi:hypothetical protein
MFVREVSVDGGTGCVRGKGRDKFSENEGLLTLWCRELEVVLLKDNYPSSKFAVNLATAEQVLHWVGICDDLGGAKQDVMTQFLNCKDNCQRLQGRPEEVLTNVINDVFMIVVSKLDETRRLLIQLMLIRRGCSRDCNPVH